MADWATISSLATAGGTLVLAGATYAAVRSANRSARVAERTLLAGLRPLLVSSRLEDPPQKVHFVDGTYLLVPGGGGALRVSDEAVYMAIGLRNVGSGGAYLHGWRFHPDWLEGIAEHSAPEDFIRLRRDLFIGPRDVGYWQGAFRDPSSPEFQTAREAIEARQNVGFEILYGDVEGGQRMISRYGLVARDDRWIAEEGRHWNLDRPSPR
jgi:hypothetical protein